MHPVAKIFDKAVHLLLKWDGGILLSFFMGIRWTNPEWLDGKMPDYKGLFCDILGRGLNLDSMRYEFLHCEVQRNNDPEIGERTLAYGGAVVKHYREVPMHLVVYIGPERCTMPSGFEHGQYSIRYVLVSARDRDAEEIFAVDTAGAIIFSFLCNIRDPETYIDRALRRLWELTPRFWERRKALNLLWVILLLRDKSLQKMVKEKINAFYAEENRQALRGSIGWEYGFDEGIEKGVEKGRWEERRQMILNLKADTGFEDERIARIVGVSVDTVRAVLYPTNGH